MSTRGKIILKRISALILCSLLLMNTVMGNGKRYVLAAEEETTQETSGEVVEETTQEISEEATQEVSEETVEETTKEVSEDVVDEASQEVPEDVAEGTEQEVSEELVKNIEPETAENTSDDDDSKKVVLKLSVSASENGFAYIDDNKGNVEIANGNNATVTMIPNPGYYVSEVIEYDVNGSNVTVHSDGSYTFEVENNIVKEDEDAPAEVSIDIKVEFSELMDVDLSSTNLPSSYFSFSYDETSKMTTIVGADGWEAVGILLEDGTPVFNYTEQIKLDGDMSTMNFTKMYLVKGKGTFSKDSVNYIVLTLEPQSTIPSFSLNGVTSNNKRIDAVDGVYISNAAIQLNVETQENKLGHKVANVYYDNDLEDSIAAQSVTVTDNKADIVLDAADSLSDTYWIWVTDENGHNSDEQEFKVCIDKKADDIANVSATNAESVVWDNIQSGDSIVSNTDLELSIDINQNGSSTADVKYSTVAAANRKAKNIYSADEVSANNFKININIENKNNLSKDYYVWTYDAAGNKSEERQISVLIDTNVPKMDVKVTNEDNETWNNPAIVVTNMGVTVYISPEEAEPNCSGIKLVEYGTSENDMTMINPVDETYSFDLGKNSTDNINQEYLIRVTDMAKNTTTSKILFQIDTVAPSVKITNSSEVSELKNKEVVVNVEAIDDMTGVKEVWGVYTDVDGKITTVEATIVKDNMYSFSIDIDQETELYSTLYVFAEDNAGNVYANEDIDKVKEDAKAAINMDKKSPTILSIKNLTANDEGWNDGAVTIEVVVWDRNDISILSYSDQIGQEIDLNRMQGIQNKDESYTFTFQTTASEYNENYNIQATDKLGNTNTDPTEVPVKIDTQIPQFQDCIITTKNTSTTSKILNALTFGMFFNESIEVDVRVTDGIISSGYKGVTLYGNGEALGTEQPGEWVGNEHTGEDGWVKFYIEKTSADMELSLSVTDNVDHTCESTPKDINDSLLSNVVVIDKEASNIAIEAEGSAYEDADGKKWFDNNTNIIVKVYDGLAGIKSVAITINGQSLTTDINGKVIGDTYKEKETRTLGDNFLLNTSQAEVSKDGSYLIEVTVTDNAENTTTQSITIYKDTTNPYIKNFEFKGNGNIEGDGKASENGYYAYYFKGGATVTIAAADKDPSSGLSTITYYTVNYANDSKGVTSNEVSATVNDKDQITFELPENFKGNVYAKATDHVQNVEENFENPNGVITENSKHHNANSAIVISLPDSDSIDKNDNPLYKNDINVAVRLTDIYMGIAAVEWSVISDYDTGNNQSGQIVVDNNKNLSGDTANWRKSSTDKNLVTSLSHTFTIQNDSNDIKILLKLTDRAGFTTEKEVVLSIDKQAPVIEVTYNNDSFDQDFVSETEYYKESRTATVVVSERNFDESKVESTITNADGSVPEIGAWTESINADEPDKSTYTANIDFDKDGDYTFDIAATDKVGNESADYAEDKFTIDLTVPMIKIDFDNNTPSNGFYYKEKRTATITIEEHNFETTRIEITGTATDETAQTTYPQTGNWSDNGDIHTATIEYVGDALYTLNVVYKDKAANEAVPVDAEEFYVDENEPEIVFEGVENMSAYNDVVSPVVTCTDKNINKDTVKVSVKVVKATSTTISDGSTQGNIEEMSDGCRFVMQDFEHTEDFDGIYTLEAEVADKAGNITAETTTFSVNRFGSVYTLSNEVNNIAGSYVKKPIDVVITETNADSIDINNIQIKLTKNGVPSDLSLGQDYSVTESGGDNSWNQYKYAIDEGTFSGDGIYIISINSTDKAGNVNENSNEDKKAEVWFGVDSTAPVVIPLDIEDKATYNQTQKQATISIEDNLLLDNVRVYLNGEEQKCNVDGGNYTFTIVDSTKSQNVEIVAADAAGNEKVRTIKDFFVTTNVIVRMVHNKTVMATCATASVATTVGGVTLFRRRKLKLLKTIKKVITK